jgi:hypothetical protein
MGRPSELLTASALILLAFALLARYMHSSIHIAGISIPWRGTICLLRPSSICVAQATAFCFLATIYSLWMLPFNRTASLWHCWLTVIGVAVFWFSFYRAASTQMNSRTAIWAVFITPAVILLIQIVFVWNVVNAIFKKFPTT